MIAAQIHSRIIKLYGSYHTLEQITCATWRHRRDSHERDGGNTYDAAKQRLILLRRPKIAHMSAAAAVAAEASPAVGCPCAGAAAGPCAAPPLAAGGQASQEEEAYASTEMVGCVSGAGGLPSRRVAASAWLVVVAEHGEEEVGAL